MSEIVNDSGPGRESLSVSPSSSILENGTNSLNEKLPNEIKIVIAELINKCDPHVTTLNQIRRALEERFPIMGQLFSPVFRQLVITEIRSSLTQKLSNIHSDDSMLVYSSISMSLGNEHQSTEVSLKKQEELDKELALKLFREENSNKRSRRAMAKQNSKRLVKGGQKEKSKYRNSSNFPLLNTTPELSVLLGGKLQTTSAEAVKLLWQYIKKEDLQDPSDRRYIISDPKLSGILDGRSKIHMFHLSRCIQKHLYKE